MFEETEWGVWAIRGSQSKPIWQGRKSCQLNVVGRVWGA